MSIDKSAVKWDDEETIDPNKVKWDEPKPKARMVGQTGQPVPAAYVKDALQATGHHLANSFLGAAQLVGHSTEQMLGQTLPLAREDNAIRQGLRNTNENFDSYIQKREADYQRNVPTNQASIGGAAVGELAPWMVGVGELRALGLLPKITQTGMKGLALKGAALSGEGIAMGGATPVTDGGDYEGQKTAQVGVGAVAAPALGGAAALAAKGAGGLASLARYATPGGREAIANERLWRLYGDDPTLLSNLRTSTGVPGFDLSPAQAIGTPEAVQAERVLRNNGLLAPAFARLESSQNAAARNQVARVAGTDADMQAALEARRNGPGAFWKDNLPRGAENGRYGAAQQHLNDFINSKPLPMPEFNILNQARKIAGQVQRGTISMEEGDKAIRALQPTTKNGRKALDQALGLIDNGMVNPSRIITKLQELSKDTNPRISGAAEKALASLAKNQDGMGYVHARVLDGLRQNFGTMLADSSPHGVVGSAEGAVYGPLKAKITNTIDRAVPGYRNNLAAYASASAPVNDMQAGKLLLDAIDSARRDAGGNQVVDLSTVRALLAKDNRANFPMSDSARQQIEAVMEAIQKRSVTNNSIAASGPGTAADLQRALQASPLMMRLMAHGASAGAGAGGGALFGPVGYPLGYAVGAGATELGVAANNSVVRTMAPKAANASVAADAIEAAARKKAQQAKQLPWVQALLPYTR